MTAREAAARVGVSERTVRRAIAAGDLPAAKQHGAFRIARADLLAWNDRRLSARTTPVASPTDRAVAELARPVTSLIGRERELETATAMLRRADVRLLTLTGAGGIGKTRLALEIATRMAPEFPDGVHVVSLAEVASAGLVPAAIAEHLGLPESVGMEATASLVTALRDARALLVLDNFEHVLAAAPLLSELLRGCPHITFLVTSRAMLRIGGEQALPVPPLDLPDAEGEPSAEQAGASPAVRLFVDRARAVAPAFALTAANAGALTAICQRLAGLPLAIELTASQVTVLPPDALLARIDSHLPLPFDGPRDAPDRQRTMTNAIAWSYALLAPAERQVFRRLGVFVGGFSVAGAEAVSQAAAATLAGEPQRPGGSGASDVLGNLAALVDASLVQRGADTARFSMLGPIRAYALERLAADGELDATSDALADWCLALVERMPMAATLPGGERHLAGLDAEHANIRRSLEWLWQRRDPERLPRLVVGLRDYWYERNRYREGELWTDRALAVGGSDDGVARGWAMVQLGFFRGILADSRAGLALADAGVAELRRCGTCDDLAVALIWQGGVAMQVRAHDRAETAFRESLEQAAAIGEPSLAAAVSARAMSNLGAVLHARGDLDASERWHGRALDACRASGYVLGMVRAQCDLADVARDRGDYAASLALFVEALSTMGERSDLRIIIDALLGAALASASWRQGERAVRLLGATAGMIETHSVPIVMATDFLAHERALQAARELVDPARYEALFAAGRQLTLPEAIAEVLASAPPATAQARADITLSRRERDVLRLLAAGLRDREIADALFISVRTVQGHVARIFVKLDVSTRVAAARVAAELGLADPIR